MLILAAYTEKAFLPLLRLLKQPLKSQAHLKKKILAFVDYFNRTMAKPFKWNYTGKPLTS
jgi:putative transposase